MESGAGARDALGYALNRLLKLFLDSCLSPLATPECPEFREAAVPPCTKFRLGYLRQADLGSTSFENPLRSRPHKTEAVLTKQLK
jgi:hypothetical protein